MFFRCNYCCVSVSWCFVTTVHASSADSTMDHLTAIIDNGTNGRQLYQLKTSFLPFSRRVFNISQFLSAPCSFPSSPLHVSVPLALKFKVVLFHSRAVSWIRSSLTITNSHYVLRSDSFYLANLYRVNPKSRPVSPPTDCPQIHHHQLTNCETLIQRSRPILSVAFIITKKITCKLLLDFELHARWNE